MEDCIELPEPDLLENRCTICQRVYVHRKSLYHHVRYDHDLEPRPQRKAVPCGSCEKTYSSEYALKSHMKRCHSAEVPQPNNVVSREGRILCPHDNCWDKFSHYRHLRGHIAGVHDVEIELETHEFDSIDDFEFWKQQVQQETTSYYTLDTSGKQLSNGVQKKYFNCHRSYKYKPKGKNIRKLRSAGSNKIGKACPSRMEVTIKNEYVQVKFWSSHYGHDVDQGPVPLDKVAIRRSHNSSLQISRDLIEVISEGREWLVSSQNGPQKYCVTLLQPTCLTPCLMCTSCSICVHTFKCSCMESVIKSVICKHIHGIAREFPIEICLDNSNVDETSLQQNQFEEDNGTCADWEPDPALDEHTSGDVYSIYSAEIAQKAALISSLCAEVEVSEDKFILIQNHLDKVIRVLNEDFMGPENGTETVKDEGDAELEQTFPVKGDPVLNVHSGFDHT